MTLIAACPKGHTDLQIRFPCEFKVIGVGGGTTLNDAYLEADLLVVVDMDVEVDQHQEPGITSGVWCPACEEWYRQHECIQEQEVAE